MRVIKKYIFNLKTKVPYSDLPGIVHRFFEENDLSYGRFMYYFKDLANSDIPQEEAISKSSCSRILRDCPELGRIRIREGRYTNTLYLSNTDSDESFDEGLILPLMNKIYRRYGFSEADLYYKDINFIKAFPVGEIDLNRDILDGQTIIMEIDILHDGVIYEEEADKFCEALKNIIPVKVKPKIYVDTYLTDEERSEIERINETAAPVTEKCREFLKTHLRYTSGENKSPSKFSLAKPMKKIGKKYGYEYALVENGGMYSLEKRTPKGNVIYLIFDSGPSHYAVGCHVSFQGVGFRISLGTSAHTPVNQEQTDEFIEHILSVLSGFEQTLLPELDSLYPETPEWFIPTDF